MDAVTNDATGVSDADNDIVTAFTNEQRDHQFALIHIGRTSNYNLWDPKLGLPDARSKQLYDWTNFFSQAHILIDKSGGGAHPRLNSGFIPQISVRQPSYSEFLYDRTNE